MIFSNTLLNTKFSNIYLKLEKNNTLRVYSKYRNIDKIFKSTSNLVYQFLRKEKKFYHLKSTISQAMGQIFTILELFKLEVKENCQ